MMVREVWMREPGASTAAGSRPGTWGTAGEAPAAMTMRSAVISSPLSVTSVCAPVKRTCSGMTVVLGSSWVRYRRPPASISSMRAKTRSRTAGQSAPSNEVVRPRRDESAAWRAASAVWTYIFVGMHPAFRHVPPNRCGSAIATVRWEKRSSRIELPEPVPMTSTSKCVMVSSLVLPVCRRGEAPRGARGLSSSRDPSPDQGVPIRGSSRARTPWGWGGGGRPRAPPPACSGSTSR